MVAIAAEIDFYNDRSGCGCWWPEKCVQRKPLLYFRCTWAGTLETLNTEYMMFTLSVASSICPMPSLSRERKGAGSRELAQRKPIIWVTCDPVYRSALMPVSALWWLVVVCR